MSISRLSASVLHAPIAGVTLALAACASMLSGCSDPQRIQTSAESTGIAAPVRPAPMDMPVTVTASRNVRADAAPMVAPSMRHKSSPMALQASADKFSDKPSNGVVLVADQAVSTFSVDVDTASYAVVRRMLTGGTLPPPAAVRVEEMVNYFPYAYPAPASRTQPFSVSTEVMPSFWNADNQLVHIAVRG